MNRRPSSPEPFPHDARIASLPLAVDGATAGPLLRRHVLDAAHRDWDITGCQVLRLRYRPEERCVVQYSVTVRHPRTLDERTELVTGTLYGKPGRAKRRAGRQPGAGFVPELEMLVRRFPDDVRLRQAPALMAGNAPALSAVIARAFGTGAWRVRAWETDLVRYREGLSLVVRYRATADHPDFGTRDRVVYAKAYATADAARRMFAYLDRLARFSARTGTRARIQRPLACLDDLATVLCVETPGRPLSAILTDAPPSEVERALRLSARTLADFNLSAAPTVRTFTPPEYVQSLSRPMGLLERACPETNRDARLVFDAVRRLTHVEGRPTHRDMKPEHILVDSDSASVIDLDSCAASDPVIDVALMLARFAGLALDRDRPALRANAATFAHEYFAHVPGPWRARLPVYYAAALVEVAAGLFHRQTPNWRRNSAQLVASAADVLNGRLEF